MVKFLTTTKISAELETLIGSAQQEITLISPYMKVNQRLQGFIQDASQRRVRLTVIYGKRDLQKTEQNWMDNLPTPAESWFVENLHAKCYLSEGAAIVTSMNLYEFSQQNNEEMGIYVSLEEDRELYEEIVQEAQRLRRIAMPGIKSSVEASRPTKREKPVTAKLEPQVRPVGYCIRCSSSVTLDAKKPYCDQHYRIWARYGDENYEEKYCHRCGKENTTSMSKPMCLPCWRRG